MVELEGAVRYCEGEVSVETVALDDRYGGAARCLVCLEKDDLLLGFAMRFSLDGISVNEQGMYRN